MLVEGQDPGTIWAGGYFGLVLIDAANGTTLIDWDLEQIPMAQRSPINRHPQSLSIKIFCIISKSLKATSGGKAEIA